MKKKYLKPDVEYINFYSEEEITAEVGGDLGGITPSNSGGSVGDDYDDWD